MMDRIFVSHSQNKHIHGVLDFKLTLTNTSLNSPFRSSKFGRGRNYEESFAMRRSASLLFVQQIGRSNVFNVYDMNYTVYKLSPKLSLPLLEHREARGASSMTCTSLLLLPLTFDKQLLAQCLSVPHSCIFEHHKSGLEAAWTLSV